jgi:hypothetical protein
MRSYHAAKVQSVVAAGYDPAGRKSPDFNEWQDILNNGTLLKITTRNGQSVARTYHRFDNNTRLIHTRDSATDIESNTSYTYDENGNLANIKTVTRGATSDFDKTVERQWEYRDGKPFRMLLITNGVDSLGYKFTVDDKKNVVDEMLYHRGGAQNQIYYYYDQQKIYYFYDDNGRLSDITRYNTRLDRLLPDFMFEYDDSDRVIQRITIISTVRHDTKMPDYFYWRYGYNDKGLKTRELMYSKGKELKGEIKYSYSLKE